MYKATLLTYFNDSYFFFVAIPPRICRWALLTASTFFTSRYKPRSIYFRRCDTSLCMVVINQDGFVQTQITQKP